PGAGQMGNTGRNFFVGPHYFELDSSLLKRIPVNERVKLELRADATNLTNSVMFGNPTADITSTIFGRIRNTVTSSSRKIQIGAKVHFGGKGQAIRPARYRQLRLTSRRVFAIRTVLCVLLMFEAAGAGTRDTLQKQTAMMATGSFQRMRSGII